MNLRISIVSVIILSLTACAKAPVEPVKIAFNAWPGYEFLYLADQKGYFEQAGANIKLIQMGSLADAQRTYINGQVDGLASTIIEAVQAKPLGGAALQIVLVPDFSNGGDVIIANKSIGDMQALKGKTVGCEVSSLGIYVLQRALAKAGLSLSDITVINVEQSKGKKAIMDKQIDAFVSYPPISIGILKEPGYHTIFTSAEIPREIIDTLSLSTTVLEKHPNLVKQIRQAWQLALDYFETNREEAIKIMAEREGISSREFQDVLSDLIILDDREQNKIFADPDALQRSAIEVCRTLVHVKSISTDCATLSNIVYRGNI